jgi:hypothetical protein
MARIDEDELIEHWTLIGGELAEVAGKRGPTRLAFALLLKFYTRRGRFPRGRGELPDEAVAYVARQVKVPASDLGLYEWPGRTFEYHRAQIRTFPGFRECTVADAGKLTAWLAEHACHRERHPERVREELLGHCRDELIEPPSANRIGRIISSALHQADTALTLRISARIPPAAAARMLALIAEASDDPGGDGDSREAFAFIKSDPGDFADDSRHASPWAAAIYDAARDRGKDHPHAVRITARAWIYVIWHCWQDGTAYDPAKHNALQAILARQQASDPAAAGPGPQETR